MKRIFYLLFIAGCTAPFLISNKKTNAMSAYDLYITTHNIRYGADDLTLYYSDFAEKEFETEQEMIDYAYDVGYQRKDNKQNEKYQITNDVALTKTEIKLILKHPIYSTIAYYCKKEVENKMNELFPNSSHADGSKENAFCHAYWTMLLYYKTSPDYALDLVYAHEDYDSNPQIHKNMDLYNDDAAYAYCEEVGENLRWESGDLAFDLYNSGKLIYIIFNYTYESKCTYYQKNNKLVSEYKTGDFYAYTNSSIPYNVPKREYVIVGNPNGPSIISEV